MDLRIILLVSVMLVGRSYAISCYSCSPCGTTSNEKVDCSSYFSSDSCYVAKQAGTVSMSCGMDLLDSTRLSNGCHSANGITVCRCKTDYCNTQELLDSSGKGVAASFFVTLVALLFPKFF
ncbi:CD59 glycoprotein-like [Watersipora subatra]|uniref:CD59 glycoprotein-like n=1 Tax=Watersipora subatra TaxID=2589382 RepID=UPI00355C8498